RPAQAQLLADRPTRRTRRQRPVHQQAAVRVPRVHDHVDRPAEQLFHGPPGGRLLERGRQIRRGPLEVTVERLAEEGLFAAERGVETRRTDSHGRRERGQRRAFVTVPPKEQQRRVERLFRVKLSRPPFGHRWPPPCPVDG